VLRLLGTRATNAEIGRRLYISPKTAGLHVTAILRKLGVTGGSWRPRSPSAWGCSARRTTATGDPLSSPQQPAGSASF
jgi:DNA-binding NarL/FixJ family response regulator